MENLLYYPTINLPDSAWSIRALLYYNQIGTITPEHYFRQPDQFDPFMQELMEYELVTPLNPLHVLTNWQEHAEIFTDYIHSEKFDREKRLNRFYNQKAGEINIHIDKFRDHYLPPPVPTQANFIHRDKFEYTILEELKRMKLAVPFQESSWYMVEKITAYELMTFLAGLMADKLQFQLSTDTIPVKFPFLGRTKQTISNIRIEVSKRDIILRELIPCPQEIDLRKIRRFKDRYPELLEKFRNQVELLVLDPSLESETPLFNEKIKELLYKKEELVARMNENRLGPLFFGTICGVFGALASLPADSYLTALPGFMSALYTALKIEQPEKIVDTSGLKYLALADKRLRSYPHKRRNYKNPPGFLE